MKFYVSRQIQWPDGDKIVEVVSGGQDYANPGQLTTRFPLLGEGDEFTDPREAVEVAIAIRNAWKETESDDIFLALGSTGGMTLELPRYEEAELREQAEQLYHKLPKCVECGDLLGSETFTHEFADHDEKFCRSYCAEENHKQHLTPTDEEEA